MEDNTTFVLDELIACCIFEKMTSVSAGIKLIENKPGSQKEGK